MRRSLMMVELVLVVRAQDDSVRPVRSASCTFRVTNYYRISARRSVVAFRCRGRGESTCAHSTRVLSTICEHFGGPNAITAATQPNILSRIGSHVAAFHSNSIRQTQRCRHRAKHFRFRECETFVAFVLRTISRFFGLACANYEERRNTFFVLSFLYLRFVLLFFSLFVWSEYKKSV